MSARLRHYQLLWHASVSQAHARTHAILLWSTAIFTAAVATVIALGFGATTAVGWSACVLGGVALFAWTMLFVPGALGLNTPVNAQLVPGMRQRLVELGALLWTGAMGMLAAGLYVLGKAPAVILLFAIAITLCVAGGIHGARGAGVMLGLLFCGSVFGKHAPPWLLAMVHSPEFGLAVVAALAPLGMLAARVLFPQAGGRHWDMMAHRAQLNDALGGKNPGNDWANGVMLRRALARSRPRALLMRAAGPDLTVSTIGGAIGAVLSFASIGYFVDAGGWAGMRNVLASPARWVLTSGMLLAFLFHAGAVSTWLARSSGEQALLRLAPAMPGAPGRFNRLLARGLLRQSVVVWAFVSATTVVVAYAAGARGAALLGQAGMCCATLPALVLVLRDHARAPSWSIGFMWIFAVGLSFMGPLAGAIGFMLFGLPFWPCTAVAAIALAGFLVRRRLRLVEAAPFAFPVGRLD